MSGLLRKVPIALLLLLLAVGSARAQASYDLRSPNGRVELRIRTRLLLRNGALLIPPAPWEIQLRSSILFKIWNTSFILKVACANLRSTPINGIFVALQPVSGLPTRCGRNSGWTALHLVSPTIATFIPRMELIVARVKGSVFCSTRGQKPKGEVSSLDFWHSRS